MKIRRRKTPGGQTAMVELVTIRVHPEDRAAWERAARGLGVPVSALVRNTMRDAVAA